MKTDKDYQEISLLALTILRGEGQGFITNSEWKRIRKRIVVEMHKNETKEYEKKTNY